MDWPFDDLRNVAVFTLNKIVFDGAPILYVSHDIEDGAWQFLDGGTPREEDASIVGLGEIVAKDPSVLELVDLPLGWCAWRETTSSPWKRGVRVNPDSPDAESAGGGER